MKCTLIRLNINYWACVESWTVVPALNQRVQPSIYLANDSDRITGAIEFSNLQLEMESLKEEVRDHAATVSYKLQHYSKIHRERNQHVMASKWDDE